MRSTRTTGAVLLLAVTSLALSVPACGDDGDDSDAISKGDYLAQAKVVCQKGNRALTAASNDVFAKVPAGQKLSEAEIDAFVRQTVIPTIQDQVRQLRAIPPPKGEKDHVEEIYDALDQGLEELEADPKRLTDGSNVFAAADKLANKYGINVCATTG